MTKTILVIEDNEQNMYLTTYLLERHGHKVLQARHGVEGIERARQGCPDLILLDIQLPQMDGYQVARRLKQDRLLNAIPIVAVTSYAMAGDREEILAAGCDGYIEKPIDPQNFVAEVSAFFPDGDS